MGVEGAKVRWLGHATFVIETKAGDILIDPWLAGNPRCPEAYHEVEVDAILITHGHQDHIGDVFTAHERCKGPIVGIFDLTTWLGTKGVPGDKLVGMNKGGTVSLFGGAVSVTMVDARHSSSFMDDGVLVTLGEAAGFVIAIEGGSTIYAAGDTCVFGDMALIKELYAPSCALLPIGDHFTMDPRAAAVACRLLGAQDVVPCHYGTFGLLTGTPTSLGGELEKLGLSTTVHAIEPGDAVGAL